MNGRPQPGDYGKIADRLDAEAGELERAGHAGAAASTRRKAGRLRDKEISRDSHLPAPS